MGHWILWRQCFRTEQASSHFTRKSACPSYVADLLLLTLCQNITHLELTESKLFALSASGRIYVLSTDASKQNLRPGAPTPSSTPWWGTGWFWGEEEDIDFAEITPNAKLGWGEKYVFDTLVYKPLTQSTKVYFYFGRKRPSTSSNFKRSYIRLPNKQKSKRMRSIRFPPFHYSRSICWFPSHSLASSRRACPEIRL